MAFVADARDGELPHLSTRVLSIKPDDNLTTILDSHPSPLTVDAHVAERHARALKPLVQLVINAILYSTSAAPGAWRLRSSPVKAIEEKARGLGAKRQRRAATRAAGMRKAHSSERVFFRPGKIPISHLRALRDLERREIGGELFKRFMVRGHWRRPGGTWATCSSDGSSPTGRDPTWRRSSSGSTA